MSSRCPGQSGLPQAAAHAAGIVHRGFEPARKFVGDDDEVDPYGVVRVGDFGLAREAALG